MRGWTWSEHNKLSILLKDLRKDGVQEPSRSSAQGGHDYGTLPATICYCLLFWLAVDPLKVLILLHNALENIKYSVLHPSHFFLCWTACHRLRAVWVDFWGQSQWFLIKSSSRYWTNSESGLACCDKKFACPMEIKRGSEQCNEIYRFYFGWRTEKFPFVLVRHNAIGLHHQLLLLSVNAHIRTYIYIRWS